MGGIVGIITYYLYSLTLKLLIVTQMFPTGTNYVLTYYRVSAICIANSMVGLIVFSMVYRYRYSTGTVLIL